MHDVVPTLDFPKTAWSQRKAGGAPALIDIEQAHNFLAALAPGETDFTFQTFDDSEAKRPELARVMHGSLAEHFPELAHLSGLGAGVFVTVNRTDLKGRRKETSLLYAPNSPI
jgi:hypothetical protein